MKIFKRRSKKKPTLVAPGLVEPVATLLDSAGIMVVVLDPKAKILYLNKEAEKTLGYTLKEVRGKSSIELLVLEDRVEIAEETLKEVLGGPIHVEIRSILRKDGTPLEVTASGNTICNEKGEVEGVVVFLQDVTERLQRKRELARESALAQGILDEATVPIVMLSPKGKILYFNTAFEDICGYQLKEVADSDWFETMIPEPWQLPLREFFESLKDRRASGISFVTGRPFENPIVTKAGSIVNISWKNNILFDQKGEVETIISFAELLD